MEVDIIGDLNCNVGATSPDCSTQKLPDICDSYQYRQLIDQPTSVTQLTSSIIDLFLTIIIRGIFRTPESPISESVITVRSGVCNKKDLYPQIKSKDCNEQML